MRPGCEQSDVDVIPRGWEYTRMGDAASNSPNAIVGGPFGSDLVSADYVKSGVPVIRGQNMAGSVVSGDFAFVSPKKAQSLSANLANPGDLVFTQRGTLGQVALVPERRFERYLVSQSQMKVTLDRKRYSAAFVLQYFASTAGQKQILLSAIQTGIPHTNLGILRAYRFPAPPLTEQRVIAEALSDVDELLAGLDRLIAKKRDLKQATMQQLLTGQTRLPGFQGEWEVTSLRVVAEISAGINKPLSEMGSGALYVTVQDLYDGTSIRTSRLSRIKVSPAEIEAKSLAAGDIVFGKSSVKREGIGYPSIFLGCAEAAVFSGFTYRARARHGIADATFLFYALRSERTRRWLIDNSQASALTNINQKIADAIPIQLPPTTAEQAAIATVLSDMDAEVTILQARRAKTRALKQGMMQELLTGKTRLL